MCMFRPAVIALASLAVYFRNKDTVSALFNNQVIKDASINEVSTQLGILQNFG